MSLRILKCLFRSWGWDYLPFRLWIGLWTGFFLLLILVTDSCVYLSYITRFTEESFATLVALIFIKKAISKVSQVYLFTLFFKGAFTQA